MTQHYLEQRLAELIAQRDANQQMANSGFLVLVPLRDRLQLDNEIRHVQQQLERLRHE